MNPREKKKYFLVTLTLVYCISANNDEVAYSYLELSV
jgi:hypothetical protein